MVCCPFTFQSRLGQWVVNQQSGKEAQDMFPVHLMGFQNLLQLAQQLLHTEDHSQLEKNQQRQRFLSHYWVLYSVRILASH